MKRNILLIGLLCVVVGGGCLLLVQYHKSSVSDTENSPQTVAAVAQVSNSGVASSSLALYATSTAANPNIVNGITFEIVTTPAAQERGLGGRSVIPDNYAMLFVFPSDGTYGFWMKDMLTSIDMIWLTDNGTIAAINSAVPVDSYPGVFYPPYPIRYVLETRAGFAKERSWHVGTQVALPPAALLPIGK